MMPILVDPTGQTGLVTKAKAPRIRRSLHGARVCLIDNGKEECRSLAPEYRRNSPGTAWCR
jgi:hypothetical protein